MKARTNPFFHTMEMGATQAAAKLGPDDNVGAMLVYPYHEGVVRATFQLMTTTSAGGGNFEHFMGTECSIRISEDPRWTKIYREPYAPAWDRLLELRLLVKELSALEKAAKAASKPVDIHEVRAEETGQVTLYNLPIVLDKSPALYHLENFFGAIRAQCPLTSPADEVFPSEALVWKVIEAIEARKTLDLKAQDFAV